MHDDLFLAHYGVKGMKWGVRHERERSYRIRKTRLTIKHAYKKSKTLEVSKLKDYGATYLLGKNRVDTYLSADVSLSRVQSKKEFEKFAFYATYKKHDVNMYSGLFGKNLQSRGKAAAKQELKIAKKSGDKEQINKAYKNLDAAKNMDIYRLSIRSTKRLKVPSDQNASKVVGDLLKDKDFNHNLQKSISASKKKMLRPSQQKAFSNAQLAMRKPPNKMSNKDRESIYKALNLTLTYHEPHDLHVQDKFYGALKKKGYSALVDINDQQYSSYHAKRPMIVFDTNSTKLKSVSKMDDKQINKLYKKYNKRRVRKEIPRQVLSIPSSYGKIGVNNARTYTSNKMRDYLNYDRR